MPCYYPLSGYRDQLGSISLRRSAEAERVDLPCGGCLGCRMNRSLEWALRCKLELLEHREPSSFVTLTYADEHLPPTLQKLHLSAFVKRLRARVAPRRFRFFACGEYGERTRRPHYHAILFGLRDSASVQASWSHGFTRSDPVSDAVIAYVAGYTAKKLSFAERSEERLDTATGELFRHQPPFLLMSRRPGVGGAARRHWRSWQDHAIWDGRKVPVPRFLHESWLQNAGEVAVSDHKARMFSGRKLTRDQLDAALADAEARRSLASERRKL